MISSRDAVSREAVASHYDELDHFYRDVWGEHVHHGLWLRGDESREEAVLQLVDLVARQAQIGNGTSVCDIGCGYGATARVLASRGADVTAMTISPAQHKIAQQLNASATNPRFLLGDWLQNNLPGDSFDATISVESSEHMPDKSLFFTQAHRVLRPNGRLVICAWLAAEQATPRAERWLLEPICREGRMPHMGSVSDYQSLGEAAGFRLDNFQDVTQAVARTWPAIVRRLLAKFATNPRYLRFLFARHASNRIFALTILRICLAYRTGAMRYGVFTFVKP
jgi:tocopherol O-methyltransferase